VSARTFVVCDASRGRKWFGDPECSFCGRGVVAEPTDPAEGERVCLYCALEYGIIPAIEIPPDEPQPRIVTVTTA